MRVALPQLLAVLAASTLLACGDSGGTTPDGGTPSSDGSTLVPDGQSSTGGLGAPCTCSGAECEQMGVPKPAGGTIEGCDEVPTDITGAALVCLRSYEGDLATNTYFANGYCALMATTCTGAALICNSAVFGDYASMTACPAGSVMLANSQDVDVLGQQATVENKTCVKPCATSADCRANETDPVLGDAPTQYDCIDKGGVKFCYDPRNLSTTATATAF